MSAFDKSDTVLSAFSASGLTLHDRLAMIDAAYAQQDQATCAVLIDSFYAFVDAAEGRR